MPPRSDWLRQFDSSLSEWMGEGGEGTYIHRCKSFPLLRYSLEKRDKNIRSSLPTTILSLGRVSSTSCANPTRFSTLHRAGDTCFITCFAIWTNRRAGEEASRKQPTYISIEWKNSGVRSFRLKSKRWKTISLCLPFLLLLEVSSETNYSSATSAFLFSFFFLIYLYRERECAYHTGAFFDVRSFPL